MLSMVVWQCNGCKIHLYLPFLACTVWKGDVWASESCPSRLSEREEVFMRQIYTTAQWNSFLLIYQLARKLEYGTPEQMGLRANGGSLVELGHELPAFWFVTKILYCHSWLRVDLALIKESNCAYTNLDQIWNTTSGCRHHSPGSVWCLECTSSAPLPAGVLLIVRLTIGRGDKRSFHVRRREPVDLVVIDVSNIQNIVHTDQHVVHTPQQWNTCNLLFWSSLCPRRKTFLDQGISFVEARNWQGLSTKLWLLCKI